MKRILRDITLKTLCLFLHKYTVYTFHIVRCNNEICTDVKKAMTEVKLD